MGEVNHIRVAAARRTSKFGTVEAQKGSAQTRRRPEWMSMRRNPQQFIERGT